jgi:hypothetical protein
MKHRLGAKVGNAGHTYLMKRSPTRRAIVASAVVVVGWLILRPSYWGRWELDAYERFCPRLAESPSVGHNAA